MIAKLRTFATSETGATAIEYGLIAALVSVASITAFQQLGGSIGSVFVSTSNEINGALQ